MTPNATNAICWHDVCYSDFWRVQLCVLFLHSPYSVLHWTTLYSVLCLLALDIRTCPRQHKLIAFFRMARAERHGQLIKIRIHCMLRRVSYNHRFYVLRIVFRSFPRKNEIRVLCDFNWNSARAKHVSSALIISFFLLFSSKYVFSSLIAVFLFCAIIFFFISCKPDSCHTKFDQKCAALLLSPIGTVCERCDVICFRFECFFFSRHRGKESDVLFTFYPLISGHSEPSGVRSYWCSREICLQQIQTHVWISYSRPTTSTCNYDAVSLQFTHKQRTQHTLLFTADTRKSTKTSSLLMCSML